MFLIENRKRIKKQVGNDYGGAKCPKFNLVGPIELDNLELAKLIASSVGKKLKYKIDKLVNFPSVKFDKKINKVIINKSKKLKYTYLELFSGAGHDAQMLANICPTSMIFVPSEKGISHDSKENTKKSDIKKGLNLLYSVTKEIIKE